MERTRKTCQSAQNQMTKQDQSLSWWGRQQVYRLLDACARTVPEPKAFSPVRVTLHSFIHSLLLPRSVPPLRSDLPSSSSIFSSSFSAFLQCRGWNPMSCTCSAEALPLPYIPRPHASFVTRLPVISTAASLTSWGLVMEGRSLSRLS